MITQEHDGSWSFTHGAQTYTGYPSHEAAATALYDLERGQAPVAPDAHLTLAQLAQTPELCARLGALSPEAQRVVAGIIAYVDALPLDQQEPTLAGILAAATEPPLDDDGERLVELDDGHRSGVHVCRHDDREGPSWVNFAAGEIEISANFGITHTIHGGPVVIYLAQDEVDGPWTLDNLRQLHADLGRILAHSALPDALTEAWGFYNQHNA